jgi:hypothetical protein
MDRGGEGLKKLNVSAGMRSRQGWSNKAGRKYHHGGVAVHLTGVGFSLRRAGRWPGVCVRLRRMGEDADETGLHRLTWFSAHDAARDGRNGAGAAGPALCRGKFCRREQTKGGEREQAMRFMVWFPHLEALAGYVITDPT